MYQPHRLDTPPPDSRFRRPWSPEPYDPLPASSGHGHGPYPPHGYFEHRQRREASENSVEALDLADYAATLRPQHNPYYASAQWQAYDSYPPSPQPIRSLPTGDSLVPPSLTSASTSSQSHSSSSRTQRHRPFSLPPPLRGYDMPGDFHAPHSYQAHGAYEQPELEVDIGNFPAFSRGWYQSKQMAGVGTFNGTASGHHTNLSPFDPAYSVSNDHSAPYTDPYSPSHSYPYGPQSMNSHESSRNLLPWSGDHDYGPKVDDATKEERMRILKREFGGRNMGARPGEEDEEERVVGSVDGKGSLITEGPKKRSAVRFSQGVLALGVAIAALYGVLVVKPKGKPPPQGTIPAYLLYFISIVTFLLLAYVFLLRPCCTRKSKRGPIGAGMGPNGMILPVQQLPGGAKQKSGKGKKGKKGGQDSQGVQVNLIVDPGMFCRQEESEDEEDAYGDENVSVPGGRDEWGSALESSSAGQGRGGGRRRRPKRRSVFAGLAMEEQWRAARSSLKRFMVLDVALFGIWGAEFVYILFGKRCPAGDFEGWCNSYNTATAASCLLAVAFGFSIFFDVKDLHASKASPRTRT